MSTMSTAMKTASYLHQSHAKYAQQVPKDLPVWRKDGRDIKLMKKIIEKQVL